MAEETQETVEKAQAETPSSMDEIIIPEADLEILDDALSGKKKEEISSDAEKVKPEEEGKTKEEQEQEEEPTFAIDAEGAEKFTAEQIKKWRDDSKDVDAFISTTREKTKELSTLRKSLDPIIKLAKTMKDKGENNAEIKEYFIEELGISKEIVDTIFAFEEGKFEDPLKEELETEKTKGEQKDKELALIKDKGDFCKRHNVKQDVGDKVYDWALKKNEETGEMYTLDTAYALMEKIPKLEKQIEKLKSKSTVEVTTVPAKQKGATTIEAKKPETIEELGKSIKTTPEYKKLEEEIGK